MKTMKSVPLNDELYNYILDTFVPPEDLLDELVAETEKEEIPLIQVAPEQGRLLYLFCRIVNAKDALEIGTLTGYSGIHMARGITGKLTTVDINPRNSAVAGRFFEKAGLKDKVELIVAPAADYMKQLVSESKKFDVIFIDADKESYPIYFEEAIKLSNTGSLIIFDNAIRHGRIIEVAVEDDVELKATQRANSLMGSDSRIESLLIPIGDGFTIGRVK